MTTFDTQRRIVCAANRIKATGVIVCGARHYDNVMHPILAKLKCSEGAVYRNKDIEQGFINTWGEFLSREDAWMVACANNQVMRYVGSQTIKDFGIYGTELFSENLY